VRNGGLVMTITPKSVVTERMTETTPHRSLRKKWARTVTRTGELEGSRVNQRFSMT
jgi:hypothetical protein